MSLDPHHVIQFIKQSEFAYHAINRLGDVNLLQETVICPLYNFYCGVPLQTDFMRIIQNIRRTGWVTACEAGQLPQRIFGEWFLDKLEEGAIGCFTSADGCALKNAMFGTVYANNPEYWTDRMSYSLWSFPTCHNVASSVTILSEAARRLTVFIIEILSLVTRFVVEAVLELPICPEKRSVCYGWCE